MFKWQRLFSLTTYKKVDEIGSEDATAMSHGRARTHCGIPRGSRKELEGINDHNTKDTADAQSSQEGCREFAPFHVRRDNQ